MENWYAPGEVKIHQMSDEEKLLYARKKRNPWETKAGKADLDGHRIGAHRSPLAAVYVEKEVIRWKLILRRKRLEIH